MTYFLVDSFRLGIDRRRDRAAAVAGSLWFLQNAHITAGGDIEKRKAFVSTYDVTGSVGLASIGDRLFVFGAGATPPPGIPLYTPPATYTPNDPHIAGVVGMNYLQLHLAAGEQLNGIYDWDVYDGHLYVVANGLNNLPVHYFDGNPVPGGKGQYIKVFREKIYGVANKLLNFSAVGNPTDWAGTGSGFINPSSQATDAEAFRTVEVYFDQLALLAERSVQMWQMDPDPNLNQQMQVLRAIGTYAPLSVRQYGEGDILMLASSGIRSLKAKNSSLAAGTTDVGSPIDQLVREQRNAIGKTEMGKAVSVLNPSTGRFWLACKDTIYVLSNFTDSGITAWSQYFPGFTIDYMTETAEEVAVRSGNTVYIYGGADTMTYDSCPVLVETPYLGTDKPAHHKHFQGFDAVVKNAWDVSVSLDPNRSDVFDAVGTVAEVTYPYPKIAMQGYSTHAAIRMQCAQPGYAAFAQMAMHYEPGPGE